MVDTELTVLPFRLLQPSEKFYNMGKIIHILQLSVSL